MDKLGVDTSHTVGVPVDSPISQELRKDELGVETLHTEGVNSESPNIDSDSNSALKVDVLCGKMSNSQGRGYMWYGIVFYKVHSVV